MLDHTGDCDSWTRCERVRLPKKVTGARPRAASRVHRGWNQLASKSMKRINRSICHNFLHFYFALPAPPTNTNRGYKSDCRSSCRTWTRLNENSIWKWLTVMKIIQIGKLPRVSRSAELRIVLLNTSLRCHWEAMKEIEKLGHRHSQVSNIKRLMSSLSQVSCLVAWTSLKVDDENGHPDRRYRLSASCCARAASFMQQEVFYNWLLRHFSQLLNCSVLVAANNSGTIGEMARVLERLISRRPPFDPFTSRTGFYCKKKSLVVPR